MGHNLHREQLFLKYINGEASEKEVHWINRHYTARQQKQIIDELLTKYWRDDMDSRPSVPEEMLTNIHQRINPDISSHRVFDYLYLSKVAASILIFISVIFYFAYTYQSIPTSTQPRTEMIYKKTEFGQKLKIVLPDSSVAVLNSGTTISYPEIFSDSIRVVDLAGEAYFQVLPNSNRPFIVKGTTMDVKVLGTSFNFNTRKAAVALTEGKVELNDGIQQAVLAPGQLGQLSSESGKFEIGAFDKLTYIGWKDGVINIEGLSLKEIIPVLENWYGVAISHGQFIDPDMVFKGKLSHRSLENILEGICFSLNCQYKISGKNVEIYLSQ
ncbi:MAG: FecR family protein [Candidatus Cyclobacteriaceae bacterium M3_2C_046]